MSGTTFDSFATEPAQAGSGRSLFAYEIRRDGRIVATIHGHDGASGTTVDTTVFPVTAANGEPGLSRPFSFSSADHARRFADEALVVFEYLNCSVA